MIRAKEERRRQGRATSPLHRRRYDGDSGLCHNATQRAIFGGIEADAAVFRKGDILADDCPPDTAISSDIGARKKDRFFYLAVTVDPDKGRKHTAVDTTTGDNAAGGYDGVRRHAQALSFLGEDKFGGRRREGPRADRP